MIRFLISPLLVLVSCLSLAQNSELDSMINQLNRHSQNDSVRAQLYLGIAVRLRKMDPNKASPYYDSAFQAARLLNEAELMVKANNGLAICYGMMAKYPEAIQTFHKTLALAEEFHQPGRLADGYNGLGVVYKRLGDYPQSLDYYSKALHIYDSIGDFRGLGAAYENVGVLHDLMQETDQALESYQKAITIYQEHHEPLLASFAQDNIAVLLIGKKQYEEALGIFARNKRIYDSMQRHPSSIAVAANMGHIWLKQKNYTKARGILLPTLELARKYEMKQEEASIVNNLFEIALAENRLREAEKYALDYERLAHELSGKEHIKIAHLLYAELWEKKGDYNKSLASYKLYKAWSDSLVNEEKARAFKAQEVKIEVLEKNKQLAEQTLRLNFLQDQLIQQNRIKWLLILAAILLLATALLLYQKFTARRRISNVLAAKNEEITRQKAQIEEMNYQLENRMLRAQINPHFVFNSLGSIQHFITSGDKGSALKYLTKFSHLLRKVLESSISGNVLLHEEIQLVSMYLELEALRFNGDFAYHIDVDESLDVQSIEMPTMILQPLIENAVLHGLLPKSHERELKVSFTRSGNAVEIKIKDNGIGRDASHKAQSNLRKINPSRGLSVTEQRLATLKDKYGWNISMKYEDLMLANGAPAGTCVTLKVPIFDMD